MKQGILAILFSLLAYGSFAPAPRTPYDYVEEYGGNVDVYVRILTLKDCVGLQAEFDQAEENSKEQDASYAERRSSIGRMAAVVDRMERIGC
jgi:hypothetical protein